MSKIYTVIDKRLFKPYIHKCKIDKLAKKAHFVSQKKKRNIEIFIDITFTFTFSHFADTFIQSNLQLGST